MDQPEVSEFDSEGSESEEIPLTAAQVIEMMEEAWLNEKFSPEILPHKAELVDCLLGQIAYMDENVQNLSSTDFKKNLHQMEMDRLKFIVTSYLRTRLEKIETFVHHILKKEDSRIENNEEQYLTENEYQFAKDYSTSLNQHFEKVLRFWPGIAPEDWKNEQIIPNVHSFVFVKSKANVDGVLIEDDSNEGDLVDLREGSQMIISYSSVANLLKENKVQLI